MRAPLIIRTVILAALGYLNTMVARAQPLHQPPSTTVLTTNGASMGLVEELTVWGSQLSGIIRASPRCWTIAINALSDLMYPPSQSPTEFCAAMTQLQQDILAIELARCHSEKSGKPFITDGDNISAVDCARDSLMEQAQVDACLANLDTTSYDRYVHFTMHVQQLCVRFTDELVSARKEQAALLLAHSSSAVSKQLQDLMEKNDQLINKVVEQQELLGNQTVKMKEFSDKFDVMQDGVTHTTNNFHSIEAIIGRVTLGYSWFTSLVHFLVALNVVWLLTMNKRARKARSLLVNMVMMETFFEICSHVAVYHNHYSLEEQIKAVPVWRKTFMLVELGVYCFVLFCSSCFDEEDAEIGEESADIITAMKASQEQLQAQMIEHMNVERAEARLQMEEHRRQMAHMCKNLHGQDPFETMRGRQQQNQQNSELQLQPYHHHRQYQRSRSHSPVWRRESFHPSNCRHLVADVAPTIGSVLIETNLSPHAPKSATAVPTLLSAAVYDHHATCTTSSDFDKEMSHATEAEDTQESCRKRKRKVKEHTEEMIIPSQANGDSESDTAIVVKSDPDEIVSSSTSSKTKKKKKRRG